MFRTQGSYRIRDLDADEEVDQAVGAGDYFGVTAGDFPSLWYFDGARAHRVGVENYAPLPVPGDLRGAVVNVPHPAYPAAPVEVVLHRMALAPGAYYPRMARPDDQNQREAPGEYPDWEGSTEMRIGSLGQLRLLVSMLETVFQSVHPAASNLACHGNAIRNLLILASTECEAQWRGVMTANGYRFQASSNGKPRPSTKDYVKLLPALRLGEYAVRLPLYPSLGAIAPFRGWDRDRPTASLAWYDSYNAVKHDREAHFDQASLGTAIHAVVACWVMLAAQFGGRAMRQFYDLRDYFQLVEAPRWRFSDVYPFAYRGHDMKAGPVNYPF